MTSRPLARRQRAMIAALAVVMVATSIGALYPRNTLLQHFPTALLLAVTVPILRRWPLSDGTVGRAFGFFLLHAIGARYSYSFVPYDTWSRAVFGVGVNETFGLVRNGYDRVVHLSFGLLVIRPVREIATRHFRLGPRVATYVAPEFALAFSAVYEIFEWLLAVTMSPADADAYNGQQGDAFDSQKDMAMAMAGALIATAWHLWRGRASRGDGVRSAA